MSETSDKKIAYLVSQYPAISHTFILREVLFLRSLGWNIHVASINLPDREGNLLTTDEKNEKERTFYVKKRGFTGVLISTITTLIHHPWGFFKGMGCAIKLSKWDLYRLFYHLCYFAEALLVGFWMGRAGIKHLHVHFANPASTVGLIASKIYPITLSITVHGPDEFYDVSINSLKAKIISSSFICCISNYAKSQLMRLSDTSQWSKFEVVPLGVDPNVFAPAPFRKNPQPFSLLCIGRLVPSKGQHILISAVEILLKQGKDVILNVIGDGPDRQSLESRLKSHRDLENCVHFHGAVNQNSIRDHYKKTDLFVLASFAEGVPVVLMEAMAMEIPCVATAINGIPELIQNGVDGLLVSPADAESLAKAIGYLIENPEVREKLGKQGRQKILEKYHMNSNIVCLDRVFTQRLF